jgi:hypothetical protein
VRGSLVHSWHITPSHIGIRDGDLDSLTFSPSPRRPLTSVSLSICKIFPDGPTYANFNLNPLPTMSSSFLLFRMLKPFMRTVLQGLSSFPACHNSRPTLPSLEFALSNHPVHIALHSAMSFPVCIAPFDPKMGCFTRQTNGEIEAGFRV